MADPGMTMAPKRLSACLGRTLDAARDPLIKAIRLDSRQVEPGDLFLAMQGLRSDGHAYIADAEARGAVAVLSERASLAAGRTGVVHENLPDLRAQVSAIAARFYDHPGKHLRTLGVTGTNGKTSVAWYLAGLLQSLGQHAAYAGTLGWYSAGRQCHPAGLTTEDAVTLQARMAELVRNGVQWLVLEVSSHGLAQHRADAAGIDIAVLTNVTRDHLDDHGSLESYCAAKRRLFELDGVQAWVINADDHLLGQPLLQAATGHRVISYGTAASADLKWKNVRFDAAGMSAEVCGPWGERTLALPLFGEFNLANLMAATGALLLAGFDADSILAALPAVQAPPGRLSFVRRSGAPTVVVDYAHTPDALANALSALRAHSEQRLICVFGCGGDRDRGKRPEMAAAAETVADQIWVTSDNPRSEPPLQIIDEICGGFSGRVPVRVEPDRAKAIARAIAEAEADALVLIAGKGHEDYQEVQGERRPFDDLQHARQNLDAWSGGAA